MLFNKLLANLKKR